MYSAVALFCEDIREEKAGTETIIGIFPDNITVPSLPFTFSKIAVYLRIIIPATGEPPKQVTFRLTSGDPKNIPLTTFDATIIEKARRESIEKGAVNAGLISKAIISPFQVKTAGRIDARVQIDDQEIVCGTLNVQVTR